MENDNKNNGETIVAWEYACQGRRDLTTAVISDSVDEIGEYAFDDCRNLTSVSIQIQ